MNIPKIFSHFLNYMLYHTKYTELLGFDPRNASRI